MFNKKVQKNFSTLLLYFFEILKRHRKKSFIKNLFFKKGEKNFFFFRIYYIRGHFLNFFKIFLAFDYIISKIKKKFNLKGIFVKTLNIPKLIFLILFLIILVFLI